MKNYGVLLGILLVSGCATSPKTAPSAPAQAAKPPEKAPAPAAKSFPDQPQFVVDCRFEGQPFSISFQSKSGKLENNDMAVSLMFEKNEIPMGISPGWYHAVDSTGSLPSFCDGVPAFQIEGTQQFLLIFNLVQKIDKKPAYPETSLVLIDIKSKKILSRLERVGKLKSLDAPRYTVVPAPNGFQMRLIRDAVKNTEDWKWIIVKKGSLTAKWMSSGKKSKVY